MRTCWCGNTQLIAFSNEYSECRVCGTLVLLECLSPEKLVVQDDEHDFYGKQYWLEHQQEDFGYPSFFQRSRNDLTERNLYWLKTLLKYRLPSAKALELGCSHGSFVGLLQLAGYQAMGLEMSPWVAEFGRKTFDVPILVGPIETQNLQPASLDVIAMMDVLEHFPDPLTTMRRCLELLKPDGILLIQTPQFKGGISHELLLADSHPFIGQLKSGEHLYLFSEQSVTEFFKRLGAEHLQFEPAIFAQYDMFLAVSRQPLRSHSPKEVEQALSSTPPGRMVLAMLDLRERELALIQQLHGSELDRAARLHQIETLNKQLQKSEVDRAARLIQIEKVTEQLQESEADRAARLVQIENLTSMVNKEPAQQQTGTGNMQQANFEGLKTIAVDLTPVLPGGHNGGAKVFVLELIRHLASLAPNTKFILLTHSSSHDELALLDTSNVSRINVITAAPANKDDGGFQVAVKHKLELIPVRFRFRLKHLFQKLHKGKSKGNLLHSIQADLLFCPFTAPTYHTPGIPTVCTFYDVQYKTYPQFFEPMDVLNRDHAFREACRHATALAAISDYSRTTAIKQGELAPDRIRTIYLRMAQRINVPSKSKTETLLSVLGLNRGLFLLYPANFWKHKNHEMLLIAFSLARTQGLSESVKLVCTGAPGERQEWLTKAADSMGLAKHVILPGYMSDEELSVLLHNSRGMIFPSLYEGFGLPVIEAMAAGIPVACSNVTSLPEVAAEAAILFDPRSPERIASAIQSLVTDEGVRTRCIKAGYVRAAEFADAERMAREYLDIFVYACSNMMRSDILNGIYPDGWAGEMLHVSISRKTRCSAVEYELSAPEWLPYSRVQVQCMAPDGRVSNHSIRRGQTEVITCPACADGDVKVTISPYFKPSDLSESTDNRQLSLVLRRCTLVLRNGNRKQLYLEEHS